VATIQKHWSGVPSPLHAAAVSGKVFAYATTVTIA
jgi:hypothetical protein